MRKKSCLLIVAMNLFVGAWAQQKDSLLLQASEWREEAFQLSLLDQCEPALDLYEKSISTFEAINVWDSVAYVLLDQSMCLHMMERYRRMDRCLQQADSVVRQHLSSTHPIWLDLFHLKGASAYLLGDMEEAEYNTKRFLAYLEATDASEQDFLYAYSNLAKIFYAQGDFDRAIEYYQATLGNISPDNKQKFELRQVVYSGLSEAFRRSHQKAEAIRYALYELREASRIPDKRGESARLMAYNDLGASYIASERYDSALYYLKKALDLNKNNVIWKASTHHNLAYAYRELGQLDQARLHLHQAIDLNIEKHGPYFANIAKDYRHLGQVSMRKHEWQDALEYYQQALATLAPGFVSKDWKDNPSPDSVSAQLNLLRTLRDKSEALQMAFEETEDTIHLYHAFETVQIAVDVIVRLRVSYQEESEQILNKDYLPVFELGMELAERLYRLENEAKYLEIGFQLSENSKATLLMEHLKEGEARQLAALPEEAYEQEIQLKRSLAYYEQEIFREKTKGSEADTTKLFTWRKKVFSLKREYESLISELERNYPYYTQLKYQPTRTSLRELQEQLKDPQSCILVYSVGQENVYVFSIMQNQIRWHTIPHAKALMQEVADLRAWVQHADWASERSRDPQYLASFVQQSSSLSQHLIHPVLQGQVRELTVIPDGILGYLPFELLLSHTDIHKDSLTDFAHLPYLLKQCAIRYEYRAALLSSEMVRSGGNLELLGCAPAYPSPGKSPISRTRLGIRDEPFFPLQHNREEVEAIHELWGGKVLLGEAATESAFREWAGQYGILHLAMHAFTNDQNPLYSGLAFTPTEEEQADNDGILYAYELYNLDLQANLVVMSACNTGAGVLAQGEGIISLARAFRYGGASNIAMSLWQADDLATSEILQEFYAHLSAGYGHAEALRMAKLTYLKESNLNPPFFWSTMVFIGNGDALATSAYVSSWLLMGGILLLLGMVAALWYGKRANFRFFPNR